VPKQATAPADGAPSSVVKVPRSKLGLREVMLVAKAGGRCEFRGCNEFLYEHVLTGEAGNFAENAHIVAFREGGPRGGGDRPADIDSIDNLMLLCQRDHKLIDDNPERYPREELQAHKREHEARIRGVTGFGPSMQTTVLAFTAMIGTFKPAIGRAEMSHALMPRYPGDAFHILDLTSLGSEEPGALYEVACRRIVQQAEALHAAGGPLEATRHLSVFGLAPIPMLVMLGHAIGNKVATEFYQCHRDKPQRWTWYEGEEVARFGVRELKRSADPARVALVMPLSGPIAAGSIPSAIDQTCTIYEIGLVGRSPTTGFLRQREDLESFRETYRGLLARLRGEHAGLRELHVFPAVAAPVAVACGFDLLPKVDPTVVIYDNLMKNGGFIERLRVNT
jgi:SMODS-associated and fused to various effectors sensor domain